MKPRKISLFLIPILCLVVYFIMTTESNDEDRYEETYFKNLNLHLIGIIKDVKITNTNDCGILYIKILNSNINHYDPRKKEKYYYCVIKDYKAEILQDDIREFRKNDSVIIDSHTRTLINYRQGVFNFKDNLNILFNAQSFIEKYHKM